MLYPDNWLPVHLGGDINSSGQFLHDFSYAGYRRGDSAPPFGVTAGTVITLDAAVYGSGTADATTAIQSAIDTVCAAGGGVVQLSIGTFRVRPQGSNNYALKINCDNMVLRGSGDRQTHIFNDEPVMRNKSVITLIPTGATSVEGVTTNRVNITQDLLLPTRVLPVQSTAGYAVGDWIDVRNTVTDAFIVDHDMTAFWNNSQGQTSWRGLIYFRRVVAVDSAHNRLIIDAPTRYPLKVRDSARVLRLQTVVREIGLENFSIGMRQNLTPGLGDEDYDTPDTGAYEMHSAAAILVSARVVDSWVWRVSSYRPTLNADNVHVLSRGIVLQAGSARTTVEANTMGFPQYRGGGGNGYLFNLNGGQDHLLKDNAAEGGRHNYIFNSFVTTGNVIHNNTSINARLASDFHAYLSVANLVDQMRLDRDFLQSVNRGTTSGGAGHTTTQSVYWNTIGLAYVRPNFPYLIETAQYGWGYVVGTQSTTGAIGVVTDSISNNYWATLGGDEPLDFVEGVGQGASLTPQSLYLDQLARRRAREASMLNGVRVLDASSDVVLSTLQNGVTIGSTAAVTLRADTSGPTASVIFGVNGQDYLDNQAPFRLSDTGRQLIPGSYTVTVSLYPGRNGLDMPTQTTTFSFTVDPVQAEPRLQLALQGRPPAPHARWAVPVRVIVKPTAGGAAIHDTTLTANTSGQVSVPALPPGSYHIWVKHAHTLSALSSSLILTSGINLLTIDPLREGDADGNNAVSILDFSLLAAAFGTSTDQMGFDVRTDFNGDGVVSISDFSLLAAHFGTGGAALP